MSSDALNLSPEQAFAPDVEPPEWFHVAVADHGHLPPQLDKKIIFHGVNKSGSLCMSKVMQDAFVIEDRKAQYRSHYYSGIPHDRFIQLIRTEPPPRFFIGHGLFGNVPSEDPDVLFITQFRHPLPRILSCYDWIRKRWLADNKLPAIRGTFENFVQNSDGKAHSQIVQFAAKHGEDAAQMRRKLSPRELFERSVENIERHLYLVGIAELFEETIFAVAHVCGIKSVPAWKRDQRNPGRPMSWSLSHKTIDLVREVYRYDFELYDWAKRRFEQLLEKLSLGGSFLEYRVKCAQQYKDRLLPGADREAVSAEPAPH